MLVICMYWVYSKRIAKTLSEDYEYHKMHVMLDKLLELNDFQNKFEQFANDKEISENCNGLGH